jgi:hypothetical protein
MRNALCIVAAFAIVVALSSESHARRMRCNMGGCNTQFVTQTGAVSTQPTPPPAATPADLRQTRAPRTITVEQCDRCAKIRPTQVDGIDAAALTRLSQTPSGTAFANVAAK